jgi:NitT/TauT family transport system substrate-binding protein
MRMMNREKTCCWGSAIALLCCRGRVGRPAHAAREDLLQRRLEHLRRMDALGLCRSKRHFEEMGDKYGIKIKLTQINDYVESINQYTAGGFDACVMTNMDMLTIPAAGGVDSTALIAGDFSNGNDGVVLKGKGKTLRHQGPEGQPGGAVRVALLAGARLSSVGLARARREDRQYLRCRHRRAFATPASTAVVTWKPQLSAVLSAPNAQLVFDSSKIPGEIMDLMVVNTATLAPIPNSARPWSARGTKRSPSCCKHDAAGPRPSRPWPRRPAPMPAGLPEPARDDALVRAPAEAYNS